jgi:VanZ like family
VALALSLALVFAATLTPAGGPNEVALAPWATQQLNPFNVVGNIVLFALPSAVLWLYGWSLRRTVIAGLLVSLGIELTQLAIPGRTTATTDVLCNACGAAVGWLVARELWASAGQGADLPVHGDKASNVHEDGTSG